MCVLHCMLGARGKASSPGTGTAPSFPTLLVKWDDDPVTQQDYCECLCSSSSSASSSQSESQSPGHGMAWTSREYRCGHSFGLSLTPDEAGGRFVLQSSAALRAEHPTFLPNTILSPNISNSSRQFWLYCIDPARTLAASGPVVAAVSPGVPVSVLLFSESVMNHHHGEEEEEEEGTEEQLVAGIGGGGGGGVKELFHVPFTRNSKLTDLVVQLVDSCDNVVNIKKLSDRVKDLEIKVSKWPSCVVWYGVV